MLSNHWFLFFFYSVFSQPFQRCARLPENPPQSQLLTSVKRLPFDSRGRKLSVRCYWGFSEPITGGSPSICGSHPRSPVDPAGLGQWGGAFWSDGPWWWCHQGDSGGALSIGALRDPFLVLLGLIQSSACGWWWPCRSGLSWASYQRCCTASGWVKPGLSFL